MAEAFFQLLIENLGSLIQSEIGLIRGVGKEMDKLSNTLTTIQKVLEDAEDKQFQSKLIQNWLSKLNGIAFEIEDILDECAAEVSKQKRRGGKFNLKYKIIFKHKMGKKIKEAVEKLDALAADRHRFQLQEVVVQQPNQADWRRETGSVLNEPDHIYGRDAEKGRIVDILVKEVKDCENLSVLPIIGVGGLGKTTLAQFVYNDERVTEHFDTKLWVCVSDDFDLKAVLKAIIESATGDKSNLENMDSLQRRVRQELNEKRYLLILDDVWNENQEDWVKLKSILACGSIGASIVVTTRLKKVADIMKTLPAHCLTMLSEEQCWLLFKLRAFGQEDDQHLNLESVGRRIVKKCGGVPLAAKALGGLLRFKREEKEWILVEESHVWNLPEEGNSILPVLRLSYRHLPFVLKRCFAYCAIFPKDYVFDKEELIFHWMAHGCILSNGKEEVEDVGNQMWNGLAVRSFFHEARTEGRKTTFKMHDLVHDLAQSILEYKIPGTETNHSSVIASVSKTRQVQWREISKVSTSSIALEVSSLTTIMNYTRLRTLKLNGARVKELPSAIGKLKHLRHLDLSYSSIRTLPRAFCCLWNLQILILNECEDLKCLPGNMRYMTNLRHIFLEGCKSLSHIPHRIRELTSLKTLSVYIVGDKIGNQLDELEHLNLGGTLEIRHLERVQNHTNANLVEKPNLCDLVFHWDDDYSRSMDLTKVMNDEKVLQALQPHPNLATLEILGFQGHELAPWMKNMKNLTHIEIRFCRNCTCLPPFGDLPLLKLLLLEGVDAMEYIVEKDDIGCQNSLLVKFPSLEHLQLVGLPNLKGLLKEEEMGGEMFPNLQKLTIRWCPLLILTSTSVSSTLKNLKEVECSPLVLPSFSSNLENLSSLHVEFYGIDTCNNIPEDAFQGLCNLKRLKVSDAMKDVVPEKWSRDLNFLTQLMLYDCCLPVGWLGHLTSLEELHIFECSELENFAEEFKQLHFLKYLSIDNVDDMVSLPQSLQQIPSLQSLLLLRLPLLTSLPDWLANLTSLTSLIIEDCPKIESLPSSIQGMTNLSYLEILGCPELERRCEKANGEDWSKIAHIPQLYIYSPF
ncbi:hypothetical protein ACS0TY_000696 [Phlomoides rotata]